MECGEMILRCLLLLFMVAASAVQAGGLKIWAAKPAVKWASEAYPLGNGRMGCMVFGSLPVERIQFNVDSLWTGTDNPSGKYDNAFGAYQNLGNLHVGNDAVTRTRQATGYRRELDLAVGLGTVSYRVGKVTYRSEEFCSHPHQVMVYRLTADRGGACSGKVEWKDGHNAPVKVAGGLIASSGKLSNGLLYETRILLRAEGGTVQSEADGIRFTKCDAVTVLVAADTDYIPDHTRGWRGKPPHDRLTTCVRTASGKTYSELKAAHVADIRSLMGRVSLNVGPSAAKRVALPMPARLAAYREYSGGDPELEALLFQYGRYLLVSSSRPGTLPGNLQGIWNDSNKPAWRGDYHSNINVQMNYWPAESGNLSECHLPLLDFIEAALEPSRRHTRKHLGRNRKLRGWTARTSQNIFGGHGWKWNLPANAWYALHFWEHYAYTGDRKFLQKRAYPMIKEVCEFWMDYLKEMPDGRLVVPNGWSPEHGPREDGVAHDQQLVWDVFERGARCAEILGNAPGFLTQARETQKRLVGPKVGTWGQLMEWMVERPKLEKSHHRHTSHLFAVFPGSQINLTTPKWLEAAKVSLAARGETGDSRREWAWAWRCNLWARMRDGERAYGTIRGFLCHNMLDNLLGTHPPMIMDGNFGISSGFVEMLMQSHAGSIDLLPALPEAWPTGKVTGLKARGGVEVDVVWKDGRLVTASLLSPRAQTVTVRHGDGKKQVRLEAGKPTKVRFQ